MGLRRLINTAAYRLASTATGNAGDLVVENDTGHVAFADGATPLKYRTRLAELVGDVHTSMFVNFATKADGDPPAAPDTGQPLVFVETATGYKPQVASGKLVAGSAGVTASGAGTYADYYQVNMGAPVTRAVTRYTWSATSTQGALCVALWGGNYQASTGQNVPIAVAHLSIEPGTGATGAWSLYVCDGTSNSSSHFFIVKSGTFVNQPFDGATPWHTEIVVDTAAGMVYCILPDYSIVTMSAAEIAAKFTSLGTTPVSFATLAAGSTWAMVEHFAAGSGATQTYPSFLDFGADTVSTPAYSRNATVRLLAKVGRQIVLSQPTATPASRLAAPATAASVATTTSAAIVDSTDLFLTCAAGPTGGLDVLVVAYYILTGSDTMFWRLRDATSATVSAFKAASTWTAASSGPIMQLVQFPAGTFSANQSLFLNLYHWTGTAGTATYKAGGSGPFYPPATLTPINPF